MTKFRISALTLKLLLGTAIISAVPFTANMLTDGSVLNANALDTPISQIETNALAGLNFLDQFDTDGTHRIENMHGFEQFNGIGGPATTTLGAIDTSDLNAEITPLSEQLNLSQATQIAKHALSKQDTDEFLNDFDTNDDINQVLSERPRNPVNLGNILAAEPVNGAKLTSPYGYRSMGGGEFHKGLDLAAATGTPIYATGTGRVTFAGWMRGYGRLVEIDHGQGYKTRYGHASALYVSVGKTVNQGDRIAAVGCSGRCTGSHLHYEVRLNGKAINPAPYVAMAKR